MKRHTLLWIVMAEVIAIFIGAVILIMARVVKLWQPPMKPMLHTSATLLYGTEGSDDSLLVVQKGDSYGYADLTGKIIIAPQYEYARPFFDGLAVVKRNGKYGYIDKTGKTIIPTKLEDALDFHNGEAIAGASAVPSGEWALVHYAIIDKKGNIFRTTTQTFNDLYPEKIIYAAEIHPNGLKPVKQDNGYLYGYADETGKMVIAPAYLQASPFGESVACVETDDERLVIIDKTGKEMCPIQNDISTAATFNEGMCAVGRNFHFTENRFDWGFIDTNGKLLIDCKYDQVTPFKNGIAEVLLNGKIGYIDKTGKYIWEPK